MRAITWHLKCLVWDPPDLKFHSLFSLYNGFEQYNATLPHHSVCPCKMILAKMNVSMNRFGTAGPSYIPIIAYYNRTALFLLWWLLVGVLDGYDKWKQCFCYWRWLSIASWLVKCQKIYWIHCFVVDIIMYIGWYIRLTPSIVKNNLALSRMLFTVMAHLFPAIIELQFCLKSVQLC